MVIVFLCVANSARSQMAEGLARSIWGNRAEVRSAGSRPSTVNPFALEVLDEIGVDARNQRSKSTAEIDFRRVDLVITLCEEEVCPVVPGKTKKLHWPFKDPAGVGDTAEEKRQMFRQIRDQIKAKIELESPNILD